MHKAKLQTASLVTFLLLAGCTTPMYPGLETGHKRNTSLELPAAEDIQDALVVVFNVMLEIAYGFAQSSPW